MPGDAFQTVQHLSRQLGRLPSMEELLTFAGQDPSGENVGPNPGDVPSLRLPEHGDGPLSALVRSRELMEANPEIGKVREQLVQLLLFGPLAPGLGGDAGSLLGGGLFRQPGGPPIPLKTIGSLSGSGHNVL